ncbi:hypothetical protein HG263_21050 [Pseudoalteromonas sp. JBTF-M23]|uniref:Glycosyl transferase family 8 n=1 Tax=Pseudoalteromonas caenipelagi TaxID=2726988 RepID=A0A849VMP6_9GAMM|nr:hypothetical protein [Pseudoalteromonas caenipelagi]NOU52994.1 hypothetical protein [Pseudoalteromonas caenipelagi]
MIDKAFIYVLYGKHLRYYQETILSMSTLLTYNPKANIIVLAEWVDFFPEIPNVQVINFTEQQQKQWLGCSNYHFRLKLSGIRFLLQNYAKKIIFLDSDTLVRSNLMHYFDMIDHSNSILHKLEGHLSRRRFTRQYKNVIGRTFNSDKGGRCLITESAPMYNSGFIGLAQVHLSLFEDALWLMEEVSKYTTYHTAEQFALGFFLCKQGKVHTVGDKVVYHYWHKQPRKFIHEQISDLLLSYSILELANNPRLSLSIKPHRPFTRLIRDKVGKLLTK